MPASPRYIILTLVTIVSLSALDINVLSTAFPTILADLGDSQLLTLLLTSFLIASIASMPVYGQAGDIYGRKNVLQVAIVIFIVGSLLCALSSNMTQFILSRTVQGIGAGGLWVSVQALIADIATPQQRGKYMGIVGMVFGGAAVAGPLLGGFCVQVLTWHWIFLVNIPLGLLSLYLCRKYIIVERVVQEHAIDYLGAALLATAITGLVLASAWGGQEHEWNSLTIVGLGALIAISLSLFLLQERRCQAPILPLYLFKQRVFSIGNSMAFLLGAAMFGVLAFLPLYLQLVQNQTPTAAGLLILPFEVGLMIAAVPAGRSVFKYGDYRIFPLTGATLLLVGAYFLTTITKQSSLLEVSLIISVFGAGVGTLIQTLVLMLQQQARKEEIGIVTSTATMFRQLGGAVGTALFAAVFFASVFKSLQEDISAAAQNPELQRELAEGIHTAFTISIYLAAGLLLLTLALPKMSNISSLPET